LVDQEYEPDKFISGVNAYLDRAFRRRLAIQLTERHHEYDPTVVGREIAAGAVGREDPDSDLVAAIKAEIAVQTGWKPQPLPKRFAELLRRGDDANGIPSLLTAFRAFIGSKSRPIRDFATSCTSCCCTAFTLSNERDRLPPELKLIGG